MLREDMVNEVLTRILSTSLDVSKVRKLAIEGDRRGSYREMVLDGDTLSARSCGPVMEYAFKSMEQHKYDLVELQIECSCNSLTSLSLDAFPNLKTLFIEGCRNLKSVSMSEPPNCDKLVSFTGEGLAAPSLTHLHLRACDKLKALPSPMNTLLPNLHTLEINTCRNIRRLHLPSLTFLEIFFFPNLETLECNKLHRLTSLQQLHIQHCGSLKYMEGEKLPSSLLLLKIRKCGLLGEECKNKHQQVWPKIEHIPTILVDDQQIL
ncbi:hypothetical protein PIB30_088653 [Stylosanthes scabra]|uniref:Uncharacterized protein n=1 Tax=Stylosanthes scabra TaxID=79078 RepID=A0ABU6VUY5_9FABA|nr:hypothetical protein [Stylosanthes scabra]